MPRFPVSFNRRKSTADNLDNVSVAGPSFRVLDRSEVVSGTKTSESPSSRLAVKSQSMPNTLMVADPEDDNIFANLNVNRGSGSSNTTKTTSDDSSRHSNVSTAPSSADMNTQQQQFQQQFHQQQQQQHQQEDLRLQNKKLYGDVPVPPIPKSSTTSSFLKSAGRTFSFGGQRKHLPILPDSEPPQTPPNRPDSGKTTGRDRSMTESTVTTATPPKLEEEFTMDLGGDFSKMLGGGFDKRASVATLRTNEAGRPALAPRTLTGNRLNQPTPIQVDGAAKIEPSPYSWGSQHSNEQLLNSSSLFGTSPNENAPPVPRHASPLDRPQTSSGATSRVTQSTAPPIPTSFTESSLKRTSALFGRRRSTVDNNTAEAAEDEDTVLLKDSLFTVNRFLAGANLSNNKSSSSPSSRFGRDALGDGYSQVPTESTSPTLDAKTVANDDDNLFDTNLAHSSRMAQRFVARKPSPPRNKVMTPAQFERYRKDKEREDAGPTANFTKQTEKDDDDEDDNYEDDEDEAEKSRQQAKQRRKQEAHMAVYRQQMMKVTGEAASGTPARSSMHFSMSTPNLPVHGSLAPGAPNGAGTSPQTGSENEGEDEDEEVPLAILAAHGFPNKNRPPTRLSTMMSNPNLRAAAAPSFQRPQSVVSSDAHGPAPAASNGRLPVFARNLPQDPYGLVNANNRETLNFAGGAPAAAPQLGGGLPPGGLVGVIASEERSRAMRRGSPNIDAVNKPMPNMMGPGSQFDPMAGIPAHMMYPGMGMQQPMLTPGDQAQIQMTQQMQQFMQMQMQFMQMMANGGGANGMQRPMSNHLNGAGGMNMGMMGGGMGGMDGMNNDMPRHSFMDSGSVMDMQLPRPDMQHARTMSMVQPSSASWMQQPQMPGYAPSIRIQGANGYAPSMAPSERSNVGLPGRYRPVSHMPAASGPAPSDLRKSTTMSGAFGSAVGDSQTSATTTPRPNTSGSMSPNESNLNNRGPSPAGWDMSRKQKSPSPLNKANAVDDDDDEEGWAAMKAKRDKKRSMWKSRKTLSSELGSLIS